jgi:hypothetical protein
MDNTKINRKEFVRRAIEAGYSMSRINAWMYSTKMPRDIIGVCERLGITMYQLRDLKKLIVGGRGRKRRISIDRQEI